MTRDDTAAPDVEASAQMGVHKAQERPSVRDVNEQLVLAIVRANQQAEEAQAESTRLRATEEELRTVAEFRERLIGVIGHDLRNPLNAISMAAGLLVAGNDLTDTDAELARRIVSSCRRMNATIGQVLEFTRARLGGAFPLDLAETNLGLLCEQIAAELRLGAAARIDTTVRGHVTGMWDANRLAEAISNVAGNAADYATPGTTVSIEVLDVGADVVVAITNYGPCIPEDLMPVLFDPFQHGRSDGQKSGHLGLGLYIAHEIARSHGGALDARSRDGTTTFTMRLPRSR